MSALDAIYRVPAIPSTPTKVLASGFTECGGGMAANASVAVARLGGDAHYWGRVGADALGDRILAELAVDGVDVGAVRRIAGCISPSAAILVDDQGERLVCAYNDPALDADPSWLPLDALAHCQAVLADVRWPEGAAAVFAAAARYGILTVFDGDVGTPRRAARSGPARDLRRVLAARIGAGDRVRVCRSRAWPRSPAPSPGSSGSRWVPTGFSGARVAQSAGPARPR